MSLGYIRINLRRDYYFYVSFFLFAFFCLTNVLRWLPVITVQMPLMMVCFLLLCLSVLKAGSKRTRNVFAGTVVLVLVFNFIFFFPQVDTEGMSFVNIIGANYSLFLAGFPILFLASGGFERVNKKKLWDLVVILVVVTSITTIIGTYRFSAPCRELATHKNVETDNLYKQNNIGGFAFIYFLVLIIPYLVNNVIRKLSVGSVGVLAITLFCIIRSEYAIAILLAGCMIGVGLLLRVKNRLIKVLLIIACVLITVNVENILVWAYQQLSDSYMIADRIEQVLRFLRTGSMTGDMELRKEVYGLSLNTFLQNPLFGGMFRFGERVVGGHSEVLDFIGQSGLFGVVCLFFAVRQIMRMPSMRGVKKDGCLILMYIALGILAVLNPVYTPELLLAAIGVPILYNSGANEKAEKKKRKRYIIRGI